jgi:hypothetical protein
VGGKRALLLLLLIETVTSAATCCSFVDDKAGVVTVKMLVLAEAKCWNRRKEGRGAAWCASACRDIYYLWVREDWTLIDSQGQARGGEEDLCVRPGMRRGALRWNNPCYPPLCVVEGRCA